METDRSKFDGGGSILKSYFVQEVRDTGRVFGRAFEWCSGMGEIGEALFDAGLCQSLCLADINAEALNMSRGIATTYVSDNMRSIPDFERFDLVVSNPPSYFNIQSSHPMGKVFGRDLRANDRGWKIHKDFYRTIRKHLEPGALLLIHEVQPHKLKFYFGHHLPYDVREETPVVSFKRMIADAGLIYEGCTPWDEISYVLKVSNPN